MELQATRSVDAAASATPEAEERHAPPPLAVAGDALLVHVRYWPSAMIWEIAACPNDLTKEEWLERLMARHGDRYETRMGGRGFFKLTRAELEALHANVQH
jgi:hypothetical protein